MSFVHRGNKQEAEMVAVSEQHKRQQEKLGLDLKALNEKNKAIAVLERNLLLEKNKARESEKTEAALKQVTENNAACQRLLQEREEELARLKPAVAELKMKVDHYENQKHPRELGRQLADAREELAVVKDANATSRSTIREFEERANRKEWVLKSLRDDSLEQRSRESHFLAHIDTLNEKIGAYEEKFQGKGVDVPILLAKLQDHEARAKHLQGKVRLLTKKKLHEMSGAPSNASGKTSGGKEECRQVEADSVNRASSDSSADRYDKEEGTFASHTSEDGEEHTRELPPVQEEEGFLGRIHLSFYFFIICDLLLST